MAPLRHFAPVSRHRTPGEYVSPGDAVGRWVQSVARAGVRRPGSLGVWVGVYAEHDLLLAAGFTIKALDVFYEKGAPKPMGAASLGVAVASLAPQDEQ